MHQHWPEVTSAVCTECERYEDVKTLKRKGEKKKCFHASFRATHLHLYLEGSDLERFVSTDDKVCSHHYVKSSKTAATSTDFNSTAAVSDAPLNQSKSPPHCQTSEGTESQRGQKESMLLK